MGLNDQKNQSSQGMKIGSILFILGVVIMISSYQIEQEQERALHNGERATSQDKTNNQRI